MQTGLIPRAEQAAHNERVRISLLKFLSDEIYSIPEVIQILIGYKTKQGTIGLMQKLEKDSLVKCHKMKSFAGKGLYIWGITVKGMYAINDPDELPERVRAFEPSRISLATLDHKLEIQLTKIYIENELGWNIQNINVEVWDKKQPDIICTKPNLEQELIAVEVELTIKSQKRYGDIISTYRSILKDIAVRRVVWLTSSEKAAAQLRSIFKNISEESLELHRFMTLASFRKSVTQEAD